MAYEIDALGARIALDWGMDVPGQDDGEADEGEEVDENHERDVFLARGGLGREFSLLLGVIREQSLAIVIVVIVKLFSMMRHIYFISIYK